MADGPTPERKIVLANGITLYPDRYSAPMLQDKARRKGFAAFRVFVAEEPNGDESYLLVDGQTPIFEHTQMEAVACWIDVMAMDRDMPR